VTGRLRSDDEHGGQGRYRRGCRCVQCRMGHAFRQGGMEEQAGRHRRIRREPQPAKVELWKRALELDAGGALADHLAHERPFPMRLTNALIRAPIVDESELEEV
jgi:hypothetical protein